MEENKCEKCGSQLIPYKKDRTIGMICPNCGFGYVTSYFEPIELDTTIYTVTINKYNTPSTDQIKTVAKIINKNLLITAKLLKDGNASFYGLAIDIQEKINVLKSNNLIFSITPDYKY